MSAKVPLDHLFKHEADLQEEVAELLKQFTEKTGFVVKKIRLLKHQHGDGYAVRIDSELPKD